jgi:hypothetical protein
MSLSRKRLATFQKAQASLPKALRLENRNDLDQYHQAEKAASTIAKYRSGKRWFIEYLEFQHPNEDANRFFNPSHSPLDRSLLKKYVIFMAQSRVGYINDSISVRTLINYTRILFTVLGIDRHCPLEKDTMVDIFHYISNDLIHEYGVSQEQWKKLVAHSKDLTHLMKTLFSASFLGTFSNGRQVINLAIFLHMLVDSSGRGGEIAWDRSTPVNTCLL